MKINVKSEKIKMTKAISDHLEKKIFRLEKYFGNSDEQHVYVKIKIDGLDQIVEITIPTKRFTLRAEERHTDLYAAIDLVLDKLEGQIRKNKTKLKNTLKKSNEEDLVLDFDISSEEEEKEEIVKRKNIDTKPMTEAEALLQMALIDHDFFMFKNVDEDCVSTLYKRKNGTIGIINVK